MRNSSRRRPCFRRASSNSESGERRPALSPSPPWAGPFSRLASQAVSSPFALPYARLDSVYLLTTMASPARREDLMFSSFSHLFAANRRCCSSIGYALATRKERFDLLSDWRVVVGERHARSVDASSSSAIWRARGCACSCRPRLSLRLQRCNRPGLSCCTGPQTKRAREQMTSADASAALA